MKNKKKLIVTLLFSFILFIAVIYNHPLFRPMFHFTTQQNWSDFTSVMRTLPDDEAQKIWDFNSFYDRTVVYLAKNQEILVPDQISQKYSFAPEFTAHTVFISGMLKSIEGAVEQSSIVFLTEDQITELRAEERIRTDNVQILYFSRTQEAMIIAEFPIDIAANANGYLYLDLKDSEIKKSYENKKWVVVTVLDIK
jgi:hypothetical protein